MTAQIPIEHTPNPHNEAYLRAKAERMGHTLHHQGLNLDEELHAEREQAEAAGARPGSSDRAPSLAGAERRPRRGRSR